MKKLSIKHILSVTLAAVAMFAVTSCSDVVDNAAQNGYATFIQKRTNIVDGWTTFEFDQPISGQDKIYAECVASPSDATKKSYHIRAQSAADIPFNYLDVLFTPSTGEARVTVQEYTDDTDPKKWHYVVTGIGTDSYHLPKGSGAIFELNISRSPENGVKGDNTYSDLTYQYYPLLGLHVVAPLK